MKYSPEMCKIIIDVAKVGGRLASMCVAVGAPSKEVFKEWLTDHPEFQEAYVTARLHSEAFYDERALEASLGQHKGVNAKLLELILQAEFPESYGKKDKVEEEVSLDDLDEKIKLLQEQLTNE